jgi:hypothetical protein
MQFRLKEEAFSRTAWLSFPRPIARLLRRYTSKVQSDLDAFFANLPKHADVIREISAQAFSKTPNSGTLEAKVDTIPNGLALIIQ